MEHIIGGIGTALVVGAYFLVSSGRLASTSIGYQGINLIGAVLLTIYGFLLFAWATVALNAIWGFIAIAALARIMLKRSRQSGLDAASQHGDINAT